MRPLPTDPTIQRHFSDLSEEALQDYDYNWAIPYFDRGATFGWRELLESPRVLILAEAGTGKSFECRQEQRRQWNEGKPAFFLELASLAYAELTSTMDAWELNRFEAWKEDPASTATFFLDAIDELNLTKVSFDHALRSVSRAIGHRADRARFVVTSRPTEFDRSALVNILPVARPPALGDDADPAARFAAVAMGRNRNAERGETPPERPLVRHVTLVPLTVTEIEVFVAERGVKEPGSFTAALKEKNALGFTGRPQDLIELANDWRIHGELRSHREQVELNVRVKLKANRQKERQLALGRALEGARALALAALLMRRLTFKHGAESDSEGAPDAVIDPVDVLASWTQDEHRALLERPLFGHASYGRVRFHHRSVIEYLAAEQLHALHLAGLPDRDLRALLFAETPEGIRVVKPSMRPTAVWLAAQLPQVFGELIDREPQALLQYGDPATLAPGDRLLALRAYVAKASKRKWDGTDFAAEQIQRIATDEVIAELPALWSAGVSNPEVTTLLLQLFSVRPTQEGADIAMSIVGNVHAPARERGLAARVLVAWRDSRLGALAYDVAHNGAGWPREAAVAVAMNLLPDAMSPGEICALLERMPPKNRTSDVELSWYLTALVRNGDGTEAYVDGLLEGLMPLIIGGMVWDDESWPHLRTTRHDLIRPVIAICNARLDAGILTTPLLCAAVIAGQLSRPETSLDNDLDRLRTRIHGWPARLRRVAFFAADALNQAMHPETDSWSRLYAIIDDGLLSLNSGLDSEWAMDVAADPTRSTEIRSLVLEALMHGLHPADVTPQKYLKRLAVVMGDDPTLLASVAKFTKRPRVSARISRLQAERVRREQQQAEREAQERQLWIEFWNRVVRSPDDAFGSDRVGGTVRYLWGVMQNVAGSFPNFGWNRPFLETHFTAAIAARLRDALMRQWRTVRPALSHERTEAERFDRLPAWSLGVTALAAEAEDPAWARRLTGEEAALAARYASVARQFPSWFLPLVEAHPTSVLETLAPELEGELDTMFKHSEHAWLVQNVAAAVQHIRELFIAVVEEWFEKIMPSLTPLPPAESPPIVFQHAIRLLTRHGQTGTRASLEQVATRALDGPLNDAWALQWFHTLFALNPCSATDRLEQRLSSLRPKKLGEGVLLIADLFGDRYGNQRVNPKDVGFSPQTVLRLTRLAYTHVRRKDDAKHVGSYTPDLRDAAETGRSAVLGALLDADGAGAWDAKIAFSKDPLIVGFRDRAVSIATEHAASASEGPALTAVQLRAVLAATTMPPMTSDQMFVLLCHRLDDIEDRMRSDTSPRDGLALIGKEYIMRRALARELETLSSNAYIIDQESVSGEEKEMDIRLISTASPQTGVIELKLGEKWSGPELKDTIETQLVTRYLAPKNRKAGCLLVTVSKDVLWKHPVSGAMLDIDGLRHLLTDEAGRVSRALGNTVRLEIRVLDLRAAPRQSQRRSARKSNATAKT